MFCLSISKKSSIIKNKIPRMLKSWKRFFPLFENFVPSHHLFYIHWWSSTFGEITIKIAILFTYWLLIGTEFTLGTFLENFDFFLFVKFTKFQMDKWEFFNGEWIIGSPMSLCTHTHIHSKLFNICNEFVN